MAKQKKASNPLAESDVEFNVLDTDTGNITTAKKEPKVKGKVKGKFAKTYYIRGFGKVNAGDAVTKEAMDCWNKIAKAGSKPATI